MRRLILSMLVVGISTASIFVSIVLYVKGYYAYMSSLLISLFCISYVFFIFLYVKRIKNTIVRNVITFIYTKDILVVVLLLHIVVYLLVVIYYIAKGV